MLAAQESLCFHNDVFHWCIVQKKKIERASSSHAYQLKIMTQKFETFKFVYIFCTALRSEPKVSNHTTQNKKYQKKRIGNHRKSLSFPVLTFKSIVQNHWCS